MKNSSRRSVLACAASLLACGTAAAQTPAIALIEPADAAAWQAWVKDAGWQVISPAAAGNADARVQAVAAAVQDAIRNGSIDRSRVYLAGRGAATASVFYAISRAPDLWAAAVAVEGSPQPAIDTGGIFAANFSLVPVLWVSSDVSSQTLAAQLAKAGLPLEWRAAGAVTNAAILEWLAKHKRDDFPAEIDCETNSPIFASCYWIQMTKLDANERNDVLPATVLRGGSGASLDLGGFGYRIDDAGPGVLVSFLPEKYSGPLKMGDRLTALDGRNIADARQFVETMSKLTEERNAVVMVQRGRQRHRIETRIVLPRRDSGGTARVSAKYLPADREIQVISRMVKEMKLTVPAQWAGSKLVWNGLVLENIEMPECWQLSIEKELLRAVKCP